MMIDIVCGLCIGTIMALIWLVLPRTLERGMAKEIAIFTSLTLASVLVAAVVAGLLCGCGAHVASGPFAKSPRHPHPTTEFVTCMLQPPPVEEIDWPAADTVGNLLVHASTAERVKTAYALLVKWSRENYYRCMHELEDKGIDPTTVVVEDDAGTTP